ncbi:hypothetical protein SOVF_211250 [Spinacia oleracea]|nr:hypothetical protein SOVF_211250 [Spinacia oleracea]
MKNMVGCFVIIGLVIMSGVVDAGFPGFSVGNPGFSVGRATERFGEKELEVLKKLEDLLGNIKDSDLLGNIIGANDSLDKAKVKVLCERVKDALKKYDKRSINKLPNVIIIFKIYINCQKYGYYTN